MMVPPWPAAGTTFVMLPSAMYFHASLAMVIAPLSDTTLTSPVISAPYSVAVTSMMPHSSTSESSATTPANVTSVTALPPPHRSNPKIVIRESARPASGLTLSILLGRRYVKIIPSVLTVAPVLAVKTTSPSSFESGPAAASTTTSSSVSVMIVASTPFNVTLTTSAPRPRSVEPEMVITEPYCPKFGSAESMVPVS